MSEGAQLRHSANVPPTPGIDSLTMGDWLET